MLTAKSSIKDKLKNPRTRLVLGVSAGVLVLAGGSIAAVQSLQSEPVSTAPMDMPVEGKPVAPPQLPGPAPVNAPALPPAPGMPAVSGSPATPTTPEQPVPYTGMARIALMDQLQAELEVKQVRAKIAKAEAEAREAGNPLSGGLAASVPGGANALPPLPPFPTGGINSLMPPASSLDLPPVPPSRSSKPSARAGGTSTPTSLHMLEAWGAGADRQARVSINAGDKIVRVGDPLAGGKVVNITASSVVIDVRGKRKVIE